MPISRLLHVLYSGAHFVYGLPVILAAAALLGERLFHNTPFLRDSGELTTSLSTGGIAHPTGFPLQHAVGAAAAALPLGSQSLRMTLLSLAAALLAGAAMFLTLRAEVPEADGDPARPAHRPLALAVFFVLAFVAFVGAWTPWYHTTNVEVYLPATALSALILFSTLGLLDEPSPRRMRLHLLLGGLSAGMHVSCVMLFAVSAALLLPALVTTHRARCRAALTAAAWPGLLLFVLGALVVLYLPLRAMTDPVRNWGDPVTLPALLRHLAGSSIRTSFAEQMMRFDLSHLLVYGRTYASQMLEMSGSVLPLAAAGLVSLAWRRRWWWAAALVLALLADAAFSILVNPMAQEDRQTGTFSVYVVSLAAGIGGCRIWIRLWDRVPRPRAEERAGRLPGRWRTAGSEVLGGGRLTAVLLAGFLVIFCLAYSGLSSTGKAAPEGTRNDAAYEMGLAGLREAGPDALLVTGGDDLSGLGIYNATVEHRRPDVLHVVKQLVCDRPFMAGTARLAAGHQLLPVLLEARQRSCIGEGSPEEEKSFWREAGRELFARRWPVRWEPGEGAVDAFFLPFLVADFPLFAVSFEGIQGTEALERAAALQASIRPYLGPPWQPDAITRRVLSEWIRTAAALLLRRTAEDDPMWGLGRALLKDAVRLCPDNCRAWNNLGVCLAAAGDLPGATAAMGAALQACPLYLQARVNLGRYLLLQRRVDEAGEVLAAGWDVLDPAEYRSYLERLEAQLRKLGLAAEADRVGGMLR